MIQAHIFYAGNVQGVGFRYTAQQYAAALNLKGWVKNLPDGRVEMLVEGPREDIDKLCLEVEKYFEGHITNKKASFDPSEGNFRSFQIAHY